MGGFLCVDGDEKGCGKAMLIKMTHLLMVGDFVVGVVREGFTLESDGFWFEW